MTLMAIMRSLSRLSVRTAVAVGIGFLSISYIVYAREASRVGALVSQAVPLKRPLCEVPLRFEGWIGEDVRLDEGVVRVAGADDYINRRYRNTNTGEFLTLYVAYYGRHRSIVGHHPDRCYEAFGWRPQARSTETISRDGASGGVLCSAALRRFSRGTEQVTVLSVYNAGGLFTADHEEASRAIHRGIDGGRLNYQLRIMISMAGNLPTPAALRASSGLLRSLLPALESHLPYPTTGEPSDQ